MKDIKPEAQESTVLDYHDKNHNGINETYAHLKTLYYWPNMKKTITSVINQCEICLQVKYERRPYQLPLAGPMLAKRPFDVVHIDTFSFQRFLTLIDLFSKYAQAYLITSLNSVTIANKLKNYFLHHNKQKKGTEFNSRLLKEICKLYNIELHFTTVANTNSNSPIERFHSTILEKLRALNL